MNDKLNFFLEKEAKLGKVIHRYCASTKGNTVLQFYKTNRKYIRYIADRNPGKFGLKTLGTNIKIIYDKICRSHKSNYYLVLPWHFKEEILKRDRNIRKKGTRFIFPLPTIKIY